MLGIIYILINVKIQKNLQMNYQMNPQLNHNCEATMVALQAYKQNEINNNHVIVKVTQMGAGIIEVITKSKQPKKESNAHYRFLIDGYTGLNLAGHKQNGTPMSSSWLPDGPEGKTKGGQVGIKASNSKLAFKRLMEAGFGVGFKLRIHQPEWDGITWDKSAVLEDLDLRIK